MSHVSTPILPSSPSPNSCGSPSAHGEEKSRAQQLYGERFPFVKPGSAPTDIVLALARVRWYHLRMARLYFIDNRRGLGKREQFDA